MRTLRSKQERARRALDQRLDGWRAIQAATARPHAGWIRAIRDALGMSSADLAARMGVAQSTAARIEASEREGRIQLDTLRRAADALGCDFVYVLVPRRSLEEMVDDQAHHLARSHLVSLGHTMALEDQGLTDAQTRAKEGLLVDHYKDMPGLWRRTPGR